MENKSWFHFLALLLLPFLLLGTGSATVATGHRHDNSLGVNIPYENPFIYNFGNIQAGAVVRDPVTDKMATNIQFQPYGTFELYSEQLFFCGNRAEDFRGAVGPIVLTYKRVAHTMVGGVACHELEAVTKVAADKDDQQ
jgi:hypothetical protein